MMTLYCSILATALVAQMQGGTLQGKVVDDQGRPVAEAQVVFLAPVPLESNGDAVEVRTQADGGGKFRLVSPPLGRTGMNGVHVWAYRVGWAIASLPSYPPPLDLILRKPQRRTVKVEGPDGRPVADAIVSPRVIFSAGGDWLAEMPRSLAQPLAAATGPDGQATLDYLADGDKLVAVRIEATPIGTQDFQLLDVPGRDAQTAVVTIGLKPTSHLAGRVRNRAGKPVGGQKVEVWFKGGRWLPPDPVGFKNGPLLTEADGSFRTPDNLLVGSQYRVVVRAPGVESILSKWITISEKPQLLLPMLQRPLRTISGRVVDRQGKPLANVEIFQSGDGPERAATRSDADGQFVLGGFHEGTVFLFARCEGFRFLGHLVKPGEADVTVELTRITERPAAEMRMLPQSLPLEESRALALRLIEPCWNAAVAR